MTDGGFAWTILAGSERSNVTEIDDALTWSGPTVVSLFLVVDPPRPPVLDYSGLSSAIVEARTYHLQGCGR